MSKRIDMTGQQFGDWTVLCYDESSKGGTAKWICRCVCGREKSVAGPSLRRGESKGCGCQKAIKSRENNGTFVNEIGNRYGKLVVIAKDEELSIIKHRAQWVCKCDCGNYKTVSSKCLRDGKTKSCGCILSVGEEEVAKLLTKYGQGFVSQYGVVIGDKFYRFDFAIMEKGRVKCLLEYHGIQHYDREHLHWGKDATVNQERDLIKEGWAKDNNIPLYVIPYTEFNNLEKIVKGICKDEATAPDMEEAQDA